MTNKFVEKTKKKDLLEIFEKCLHNHMSRDLIETNLEHALNAFKQEMRGTSFHSFIKSSPKDMKLVFYQILVKHFIISINSDKELMETKDLKQITAEIENLLK